MLANIFMDLLCIVGIVFLGSIFVIVVMNTINEIRISRSKNRVLKQIEDATFNVFKEQLDKDIEKLNKDKDK